MVMVSKQSLRGELSAEFLGTLVLIALGDGVVAMVARHFGLPSVMAVAEALHLGRISEGRLAEL